MGYDGDRKMEKVIPLDGYMVVDMFYGKEEHFPFQSLREAYGGLFRNGLSGWRKDVCLFGEGIAGMRPLVLCAGKVWYRIWGRLRLRKVSVRAA